MSAYLANYWVLYRQYIDLFQSLRYKDIPLALISNFYQYISPALRESMEQNPELFGPADQHIPEAGIQPYYDQKRQNIKKTDEKPVNGKVILHFDHLRFTEGNYRQFDPAKTAVLARWSLPDHHGLPVICKLELTEMGQKGNPVPYIEKAHSILKELHSHPAFGNREFQERLYKDIPLFIEAIDAVDILFTAEKISAVVVGTTEDIYSRVLALMSAKKNAVSICLQHGALMGDEAFLPVFTDYQAVFGAYEAEWYKAKGCRDEQIIVTGHPRFDEIFSREPIDRDTFYRKLSFLPSQRTVLIATQPFSDEFYTGVLEELAGQKNMQLIIKPHPWEIGKNKLDAYNQVLRKYKAGKIIKKEMELYDILPYADAAVTQTSTVGLEAMLFQKPVLIGKSAGTRRYPYYHSLGEFVFEDPQALAQELIRICESPAAYQKAEQARRAFVAANYPVQDSLAALCQVLQEKTGVSFRRVDPS
ncbi:CDP-glycerol glycerophosphotransferase family protein [Bacillus velezensis]|uniref:capsular polysaccharide export protein, LipB/KpsS family n=1 Tax=Bacillus TaxID=1386 RepID=UPI001560C629|nr:MULTISPECIES: CDP-glycerol glycerophosphotransferase family protein [Bacillus amyloliquefaciens group]NRF35183.1 CDP-glycerol glycerophosphotransferase family protein [Bacillus velezensis]